MRKYYIDNLRSGIILLLFVYHTFLVFNNFGELYYINGAQNAFMSKFIIFCFPFFMPVLFLLAGVSTKYSLQKRTYSQYIKERFSKILLPCISGVILVVPFQSFFAAKFRCGFEGNYLQSLNNFFTDFTDLSGVYGGFTIGQLWFLIYLFLITLIALPLIYFIKKKDYQCPKMNVFNAMWLVLPLGLSMFFCNLVPDKSILYYFLLFIVGYCVFADENFQEQIAKHYVLMSVLYVFIMVFYLFALFKLHITGNWFVYFVRAIAGIVGIYALMGIFKKFFDFSSQFTKYFTVMSFPIYIFHQSILVTIAYYVLKLQFNTWILAAVIIVLSFILTILMCEIVKRLPVIRNLFGMK